MMCSRQKQKSVQEQRWCGLDAHSTPGGRRSASRGLPGEGRSACASKSKQQQVSEQGGEEEHVPGAAWSHVVVQVDRGGRTKQSGCHGGWLGREGRENGRHTSPAQSILCPGQGEQASDQEP